MRYPALIFLFFALSTGCHKAPSPSGENQDPPGKSSAIEFTLYVKYNPIVQQILSDEYPVDVPFDEGDQMVVSGEGVEGTLTYDKHYTYYGGYVFTGYLDYKGTGAPPQNLPLTVRRINPFYSNWGEKLLEPKGASSLEQAIDRYGCYQGTCTFGNPHVDLSLASSVLNLYLGNGTPFPDTWNREFHLVDGDKSYGPFRIEFEGGYLCPNVLLIPEGMSLDHPMVDLGGLARFPLILPDWLASSVGGHYADETYVLYDLTHSSVMSKAEKVVIYQSDSGKPTHHTVMVHDSVYPPRVDRKVFFSNIHIEGGQEPVLLRVNTTLWVDGNCTVVSRDGSSPAISVRPPFSLHILGDGTLVAENEGSEEGGAGISFGGYEMEEGADLIIDGSVSIRAKGAPGAAGIGTGCISAANNPRPYCGDIRIDTKGKVTAIGGAGAPGIGLGKIQPVEDPFIVSLGSIRILGGIVDATGGGDDVSDIGVPASVSIAEGVFIDPSVTYDGTRGYRISQMKGDLPIGYKKD